MYGGCMSLVKNHTGGGYAIGDVQVYDMISYQGTQKLLNRYHNMNCHR